MRFKTFIFGLTFMAMASSAFGNEQYFYVEGKTAKFRAGPSTNYKELWEAPYLTPLEFLAKYKNWFVIRDKDGDVGWVEEKFVGKGRTAIVTAKKVNVLKNPDDKAPVAFSVEQRYVFKVLDQKKTWLKVKDADGEEGWISEKAVWTSR